MNKGIYLDLDTPGQILYRQTLWFDKGCTTTGTTVLNSQLNSFVKLIPQCLIKAEDPANYFIEPESYWSTVLLVNY